MNQGANRRIAHSRSDQGWFKIRVLLGLTPQGSNQNGIESHEHTRVRKLAQAPLGLCDQATSSWVVAARSSVIRVVIRTSKIAKHRITEILT